MHLHNFCIESTDRSVNSPVSESEYSKLRIFNGLKTFDSNEQYQQSTCLIRRWKNRRVPNKQKISGEFLPTSDSNDLTQNRKTAIAKQKNLLMVN